MPGETHFFDDIYSLRTRLREPLDAGQAQQVVERLKTIYQRYNEPDDQIRVSRLLQGQEAVKQLATASRFYRDALSMFMELQMRAEGKQRWGNNAPRDIFHLHSITYFYPKAKIVLCVRDLRDFLCSYKYKWRATSEDEVARLKALYHPVITTLLWRSSVRQLNHLIRLTSTDNYAVVRYEDLVADPEATIRRVCMVIEEDYEPEMLEVESYASSYGMSGAKGVFRSSVGKWRTELSGDEIRVAQSLARREMTSFGYEVERCKVHGVRLAAAYLSTPVALARALWANRHKRGPLLPYLLRRLGFGEGRS
jgi:hypothetical protein